MMEDSLQKATRVELFTHFCKLSSPSILTNLVSFMRLSVIIIINEEIMLTRVEF